ncbi:MAG TPA: chemotaxis protein CheW [Caulobacteraceae bacterium]|nr:chemotaxis protein CheW [Caulobacteraceae bacterium]
MAEQALGGAKDGVGARRFLTFHVDRRLYALPADEVSEVIRLPAVARVPQSPRSLLGVANLRGSVIPLASVRALLGRAEIDASANSRAIVLDGAAPVALAVDGVEALVTLEAGQVETRQAELAADPGERLRGAFLGGSGKGVTKILDIKSLLDADFTPRARLGKARPGGPPTSLERTTDTAAAGLKLVSFLVAGQEYALGIEAVQEILPMPKGVATDPRAEALVLGVAAFRDTLLPLMSLRGLLGFAEAAPADGSEKVIVVAVSGVLVGLVADRMGSIVSADPSAIDAVPPVLAARAGGETQIKAIARVDGGRRLISILDTAILFREDVMRRLAGEAREEVATMEDGAIGGGESQFLVFRLGAEEFGLPIASVDEVTRAPEQITRVPGTPRFLQGVINLRGEVLPIVDQRRRFDLPAFEGDKQRQRLVVVRSERHRAGLVVDSVSEVLRTPADAIEPAPDIAGETARLVQGVVNSDGRRMVLVLDPAELLSRTERSLLDKFAAKGAPAPS